MHFSYLTATRTLVSSPSPPDMILQKVAIVKHNTRPIPEIFAKNIFKEYEHTFKEYMLNIHCTTVQVFISAAMNAKRGLDFLRRLIPA